MLSKLELCTQVIKNYSTLAKLNAFIKSVIYATKTIDTLAIFIVLITLYSS
jgi:hypothetical protein